MTDYRQPESTNYTPDGLPSPFMSFTDSDLNLVSFPLLYAERFNSANFAQAVKQFQFPPSAVPWPAPWQKWDIDNLVQKQFVDSEANCGVNGANAADAAGTASWVNMLRPFPLTKPGKTFDPTKDHFWIINARIGSYQNIQASDAQQRSALILSDVNLLAPGPTDGEFISAGIANTSTPSVGLWANHNTLASEDSVDIGASSNVYVQTFAAWFAAGTLLVCSTLSIDGKGFSYPNADRSSFIIALKAPPAVLGLGAALQGGVSGLGVAVSRMDYLYVWGGETVNGLEVPGFMKFSPEGGKLYL